METFNLHICYTYGSIEALQELCDTGTTFSVLNTLGSCFLDLALTVDQAVTEQVESKEFIYKLGEVPPSSSDVLLDLKAIV